MEYIQASTSSQKRKTTQQVIPWSFNAVKLLYEVGSHGDVAGLAELSVSALHERAKRIFLTGSCNLVNSGLGKAANVPTKELIIVASQAIDKLWGECALEDIQSSARSSSQVFSFLEQ